MTREYDNVICRLISGSGPTERSRRTLVSLYVGIGVWGPGGLVKLGARPRCLSTRPIRSIPMSL